MSFSIREKPGFEGLKMRVLAVEGAIDLGTLEVLSDSISSVHESGVKRLVIDMEQTSGFSSAGWGCLVEWQYKLRQEGGNLVLTQMPAAQKRIYELMGLDGTLTNYDRMADAVKFLSGWVR